MQHPAANALLLALNAVGIPVLVRALGEAHAPPSAALGVLGALFHAAAKPAASSRSATLPPPTALHALGTHHRAVAYRAAPHELLLVLVADAPLASLDASRVLDSVGAALALLLADQRLETLDAARQRLALARHAETLDLIVRSARCDVCLLLGRPVRALRGSRRTPRSSASAKVQQRVWLQDGVVVAEHVTSGCSLRLDAIEVVVLTLLGTNLAARGLRSARQVVRVGCSSASGGAVAKVAIEVSQFKRTSCIGVFSEDTSDCELQEEMKRMQEESFDSATDASSLMPDELLDKLPETFICGYASRLDGRAASPSCRTVGFLNPNWKKAWVGVQLNESPQTADTDPEANAGATNSASDAMVWRTLCDFVAKRLDVVPSVSFWTSRSHGARLLDYKREDEFFTLLHHTRGLLQFFSLCVGSLSLQQTTSVGDVLHEYFSDYHE